MDKEYHIKINGELILVSEVVYRAYQQPKWREKKQSKVQSDKELSLEYMTEMGSPELSDERQALVDKIYFKDKSEREVASITSVLDVKEGGLWYNLY